MIDEAAFEAAIRANAVKWQTAAMRITGNCDDADDAVQTALLSAWQNREKFAGEANFATYMFRVVINKAVDLVRQNEARRCREQKSRELDRGQASYCFLYEAIAKLPEIYAQTVIALLENNMKYAAAADELGCPEKLLYSRMRQAKKLLEKILQEVPPVKEEEKKSKKIVSATPKNNISFV